MKNLAFAIILFLGFNVSVFAQKQESEEKMTLEQKNTLRLKKFTLDLNLSTSQQKDLVPIIAEMTKKIESKREEMKLRKETKKKLTADEKFNLVNKNLEEQIEIKSRLSKILNPEQMKKWEEIKEKRKLMMHKRKKDHKSNHKEVLK